MLGPAELADVRRVSMVRFGSGEGPLRSVCKTG